MARPSPHRRGYGKDWQKLRRHHLARHPLCRYCQDRGRITEATVVDHIEPIAKAPHRRLDPTNLQSLCEHCHNAIKQAEERGTARPAVGLDGWPVG